MKDSQTTQPVIHSILNDTVEANTVHPVLSKCHRCKGTGNTIAWLRKGFVTLREHEVDKFRQAAIAMGFGIRGAVDGREPGTIVYEIFQVESQEQADHSRDLVNVSIDTFSNENSKDGIAIAINGETIDERAISLTIEYPTKTFKLMPDGSFHAIRVGTTDQQKLQELGEIVTELNQIKENAADYGINLREAA